MQVSYRAKHVTLGDDFKEHVESRLKKIDMYANQAQRMEVRASIQGHGSSSQVSIELTVKGKGPIIRAEAKAGEKECAFDRAYDKLLERLRRARDRRKNHYGRRDVLHFNVATATAGSEPSGAEKLLDVRTQQGDLKELDLEVEQKEKDGENYSIDDVPVYIRQKRFKPEIMSVDEAIDRMELVGHAFFLFIDEATREPSLVYRRHGWTYGEITLSDTAANDVEETERYLKYRR